MKVGLRQDRATGVMELIDLLTNEAIENLSVTNVAIQNEHLDHMQYGRPVHRILVGRKIVLTVEVLEREGAEFRVSLIDTAEEQRNIPIEEAVRFIRFPRRT